MLESSTQNGSFASGFTRLTSFDMAFLLRPSMVSLDLACNLSFMLDFCFAQCFFDAHEEANRIIMRFRLIHNFLQFNPTKPFEASFLVNSFKFQLPHGPISQAVGVCLSIRFESDKERPFPRAQEFEVVEGRISRVPKNTLGLKTTLPCCLEHLSQVVVFGQAIAVVVKNTPVNGSGNITTRPNRRDEVDTINNSPVFSRPMASDEFNMRAVRFVDGRIVKDKKAGSKGNQRRNFELESGTIGLQPFKKTGVCVMRNETRSRLGSFSARGDLWRSAQPLNVIFGTTFRRIHLWLSWFKFLTKLSYFIQLRNSYTQQENSHTKLEYYVLISI